MMFLEIIFKILALMPPAHRPAHRDEKNNKTATHKGPSAHGVVVLLIPPYADRTRDCWPKVFNAGCSRITVYHTRFGAGKAGQAITSGTSWPDCKPADKLVYFSMIIIEVNETWSPSGVESSSSKTSLCSR
jgi:hypothetical protein